MEQTARILCVDDEVNVLRSIERLLMDEDYELFTASSVEKGLDALEEFSPVQIVISDYRMPGMNGVDFLKEVCLRWPETVRIVLSGYADMASVISAINDGQVYKFIPKPWNDGELKMTIANALERYSLYNSNRALARELRERNEELIRLNEELERVNEELFKLISEGRSAEGPKVTLVGASEGLRETVPLVTIGMDRESTVVLVNARLGRPEGAEEEAATETGVSQLVAMLPHEITSFIEKKAEDSLRLKVSVKERPVKVAFAPFYRLKDEAGFIARG